MRRETVLALLLAVLPGCAGELAAFAALAFSMTVGAWIVGRERQRRALSEAETLRHAITTGQHRQLEYNLRKELALAAAGEAVSLERQWLARAQLGGLLVAEWRLDEARALYEESEDALSPFLKALASYGRHELAVLTQTPNEDRLQAIQADRDACLRFVPANVRQDVERTWNALEGLCLVRMGRAREAAPLLERGLKSLTYNPARVVYLYHLGQAYEHIGERKLAAGRYQEATSAFPGTRLADEARTRLFALGPGAQEGLFRGMLPEAPAASTALAVGPAGPNDTEDPNET